MRLSLPDLTPSTNYAIQLRAVASDGTKSNWSQRLLFTTITDDIIPKTPANVTWVGGNDSYHAEWDKVNQNTDDSGARIIRYEMEFADASNVIKKIVTFSPAVENRIGYDLTATRIKALFGSMLSTVKFRVRAVNASENVSAWTTQLTASIGVPDPPTSAVVVELDEAVKVSWTAPVNMANVTGYRVYVGTTAGFTPSAANRIYQGESNTYTYNTSTFSLHYFKIRSYSGFGVESTDLTAQGTPQSPYVVDTVAPSVPTGLAVTTDRTGNIAKANLTWAFNAATVGNEDIQAFVIKWYKSGEPTKYSLEYVDKASRSLTIPLPQAYSDYLFQIAAVDFVANYSAFSSTVTLSNAVPGPPAAVTGLTSSTGMDSLSLTWIASASGDVVNGGFYKVTIATDAGFTTGVLNYETGNTNITVSGLVSNVTYYYRVIATDSTALDSTAVTGSAVTDAFPIPPASDGSAPASSPTPTVTPGIGYLFVSWLPVTNNDQVTYEIHISVTSGFTPNGGTKAGEIQGTVANLRNTAGGTALAYGTTYYIKIVAKDADGSAAASTQASGSPAKLANSDSNLIITAADVQTGTLGASIITLGTGGIIQSSTWTGLAGSPGFQITDSAIIIRNGTISAGTLESGSTITANLSVTGNMTISSSGTFKSTNYVAGTSGFSLSSTGLDIRSGTIAVGTLIGGTISSQTITLGTGGAMVVDSTAVIRSNNWNGSSTGWQLSSSGLTVYGLNATLAASQITGDTVTGRALTVSSGGYIQSSNYNGSSTGWQISGTGFTMYNGTIYGSSVTTNSLTSIAPDAVTGLPLFSINAGGYATFSGARIYGNTILGNSTTHYVQSGSYTPNVTGWRIDGAGNVNFNQATVTGGIFQTGVGNVGTIRLDASGLKSYDASGNNIVTIDGSTEFQVRGTARILPIGASGSFITNANVTSTFNGAVNINAGFTSINGATIGGGLTVNTGGLTVSAGPVSLAGSVTIPSIATGGANATAPGGSDYIAAGAGGVLYRGLIAVSSIKTKENIKPLSELYTAKQIVSLNPYRFNYIGIEDRERTGFMAEHADELGLKHWTGYDEEGNPNGFDYIYFSMAQQVVLRDHDEKIDLYKEEITDLRTTVQRLEDRIEEILSRLDS